MSKWKKHIAQRRYNKRDKCWSYVLANRSFSERNFQRVLRQIADSDGIIRDVVIDTCVVFNIREPNLKVFESKNLNGDYLFGIKCKRTTMKDCTFSQRSYRRYVLVKEDTDYKQSCCYAKKTSR